MIFLLSLHFRKYRQVLRGCDQSRPILELDVYEPPPDLIIPKIKQTKQSKQGKEKKHRKKENTEEESSNSCVSLPSINSNNTSSGSAVNSRSFKVKKRLLSVDPEIFEYWNVLPSDSAESTLDGNSNETVVHLPNIDRSVCSTPNPVSDNKRSRKNSPRDNMEIAAVFGAMNQEDQAIQAIPELRDGGSVEPFLPDGPPYPSGNMVVRTQSFLPARTESIELAWFERPTQEVAYDDATILPVSYVPGVLVDEQFESVMVNSNTMDSMQGHFSSKLCIANDSEIKSARSSLDEAFERSESDQSGENSDLCLHNSRRCGDLNSSTDSAVSYTTFEGTEADYLTPLDPPQDSELSFSQDASDVARTDCDGPETEGVLVSSVNMKTLGVHRYSMMLHDPLEDVNDENRIESDRLNDLESSTTEARCVLEERDPNEYSQQSTNSCATVVPNYDPLATSDDSVETVKLGGKLSFARQVMTAIGKIDSKHHVDSAVPGRLSMPGSGMSCSFR